MYLFLIGQDDSKGVEGTPSAWSLLSDCQVLMLISYYSQVNLLFPLASGLCPLL